VPTFEDRGVSRGKTIIIITAQTEINYIQNNVLNITLKLITENGILARQNYITK
jgi:hypothetical protein